MLSLPNEATLRKPDIDVSDAAPIVLKDGQTWLFPKPYIEFVPRFISGQPTELTIESEFEPFLTRMSEAETVGEVAVARFDLARAMLLKIYELTDEQLASLLSFRHNDPTSEDLWRSITDVAAGIAPKPSPGGES